MHTYIVNCPICEQQIELFGDSINNPFGICDTCRRSWDLDLREYPRLLKDDTDMMYIQILMDNLWDNSVRAYEEAG